MREPLFGIGNCSRGSILPPTIVLSVLLSQRPLTKQPQSQALLDRWNSHCRLSLHGTTLLSSWTTPYSKQHFPVRQHLTLRQHFCSTAMQHISAHLQLSNTFITLSSHLERASNIREPTRSSESMLPYSDISVHRARGREATTTPLAIQRRPINKSRFHHYRKLLLEIT
jgi:hypothetical protein